MATPAATIGSTRIRSRGAGKSIRRIIAHVVLIILGLLFTVPFLWLLSTSFKTDPQIFKFPPIWIPNPLTINQYRLALTTIPFFLYLKNSLIYCGFSVVGDIISCSLVAYGLARIRWRGRDILFVLTIATLLLPYQVTLVPLFIVFRTLGWVGTFLPLIVPHFFGSAIFIFLLRQFMMTIPMEISEAARIDGAGELRIFWTLILPAIKPALFTVGLFQFQGAWNDFLGPLIYLTDQSTYTISLGLQQYNTQYGTEWGQLMAASTLLTLPIIVLFFFTQRTFIQGIALTGIKG
ncbi:MAG: carbohydrate ABC transporter permease [Chloroflexi bacterium]|nr:carbohydrate ABC transporter permease [Chloroflexota bacterium]